MKLKQCFVSLLCAVGSIGLFAGQPGVSPGPGTRYATDAYPGFDREEEIVKPEKKVPRWFAFINGPKMADPSAQFAWAKSCAADGSWAKARRAYDALVREWPTSPEAPLAQRAMADILLDKELDYEEAFAEYRYLLDFFSASCDYREIAQLLYKIAELMRLEGKTIVFFRFKNTVDVRRAYESLVMRSPGASFVPDAMLTIAGLREDEENLDTAVTVYENLRNLYPRTRQAMVALHREGRVRLELLKQHGYNRNRIRDTIEFFKMALMADVSEDIGRDLRAWLAEAEQLMEAEAFKTAKFYDSRTRTLRSGINAYQQFINDYPNGPHAEEARARLAVLQEKDRADRAKEAARDAASAQEEVE